MQRKRVTPAMSDAVAAAKSRQAGANPLQRVGLSTTQNFDTFDDALVFGDSRAETTAAVIFLHGFGDGPEGWAEGLKDARAARPTWKWVHLRGPKIAQPCYGGRKFQGWGDFVDRGLVDVGSRDHESDDARGHYASSVARVHAAIDTLVRRDGLTHRQIAIAGFSQGAAVAALAALTYGQPLAGVALLSGWLLPAARERLSTQSPSVNAGEGASWYVGHGTADDQVAYECAEASRRLLAAAGASVQSDDFKGLNHLASAAVGQERVLAHLDGCLGHAAKTASGRMVKKPRRAPEAEVRPWKNARKC